MSIKTICQVLGLSRSSYYAWKKRPLPLRAKTNLKLVEQLKAIHIESKGTYGAPRATAQLRASGYACGRKRVAGLMRRAGIFGCARRKSRYVPTTDSRHDLPIAPRVFQVEKKHTHPSAPDRVWVSDTTYISTAEGWLYLTIQLDVFTRKIVGYAMADHLRAEANWESMRSALQKQPGALSLEQPGLITHSDRGRQYASDFYREKLSKLGITPSMSRSGNCYDNAYAETFFHTLKVELVNRQRFTTRLAAQTAITEYIETWYNLKRLHSSLGYQTPAEYERQAVAA